VDRGLFTGGKTMCKYEVKSKEEMHYDEAMAEFHMWIDEVNEGKEMPQPEEVKEE